MATLHSAGNCKFVLENIASTSVQAPVLVLGKVVPTDTSAREATQDPMTGFECSDTPLGRGHLVALFLGGPDVAQNYAPQYEQWQQCGAWKRMEAEVLALAKAGGAQLYMAVEITYDRTGNVYLDEQAAFRKGVLHDWTDRRIPNAFRIWTFRANASGAAAFLGELDGAGGAPLAALQALPTKPFLTPQAAFDLTAMPDEDYAFWLRNLVRRWSREAATQAIAGYESELAAAKARKLAGSTGGGGKMSTKPKRSARVSPMAAPRLGRREAAEIEAEVRQRFGLNATLSVHSWMLDNVDRIVDYIRDQVAANWGLRSADLISIGGAGAQAWVTTRLL